MTKTAAWMSVLFVFLLFGISGAADMQETGGKFVDSSRNLFKGDIFKKGVGIPGEDKSKALDRRDLYFDGSLGANIVTVSPEVATPVEMSSSDTNRIVCPSEIKDVVFSKEKGITVKIIGKNAFIKFLITKKGQKEEYSLTPTELFVACDDNIYNIVALPKRIPSQTVRLSAGVQKIKKNAALYGGMPFEKKVAGIVKSIYTDEIPDSFTVERANRKFEIFKDLDLTLQRTFSIDGEGLTVKEFKAGLKKDSDKTLIEVSERDFLRTELTTKTVSIMVDKLKIRKGEFARLLIVESAGWPDNR